MTQIPNLAGADTPEDRALVLSCIEAIRVITPGATVGGYGYESDTVTALARLIQVPRTVTTAKSIPTIIREMAHRLLDDARSHAADDDTGANLPQIWAKMGIALLNVVQPARAA